MWNPVPKTLNEYIFAHNVTKNIERWKISTFSTTLGSILEFFKQETSVTISAGA